MTFALVECILLNKFNAYYAKCVNTDINAHTLFESGGMAT